ncbi:SRPBCC family protein [Amycolatopsis roodepoortensis]|uniref:SRPBCC family protein n=1 Tax=Amycolatopsis roodepoortensis TaxID=700274 RepID=UPI00214C1F67|nr:SRPBCC family protein [Amycolatopsis roodepoortensis]UUV34011.1 SRPBCC family protein [Amycolatopsis roodepoortensis]
MAKVQRISVHGHTSASPETVYALLVDRERWPDWSPMGSFRLLQKGDENGLGAIGVFSTNGVHSCEEVIALQPGKRFGYALKKGLPLRDYRAYVDLTPVRNGTEIHWHSTFTAKIPGTGWFHRRFLGHFIGRMVESLVARASRGAP